MQATNKYTLHNIIMAFADLDLGQMIKDKMKHVPQNTENSPQLEQQNMAHDSSPQEFNYEFFQDNFDTLHTPQSEYGNIYRNILIGANIDGFEAYHCVSVVLWVEIRKKYHWCCVGGPKLLRDILY